MKPLVLGQETHVQLGFAITVGGIILGAAVAGGTALWRQNDDAASLRTEVARSTVADHEHDLQLQRLDDGLRVLGEKLDELKEVQRRGDEKLDRLLRRGERR